jgi:hypothetical protein
MTSTPTERGSPFSHHPMPRIDGPARGDAFAGEPQARDRVDKGVGPRGDRRRPRRARVGKLLHIRAGAALSLQRHPLKEETLAVQSVRITWSTAPTSGTCRH